MAAMLAEIWAPPGPLRGSKRRGGRGRASEGQAGGQGAWRAGTEHLGAATVTARAHKAAGAGQPGRGGTGPSQRRRPPSSGGSVTRPEPRLVSAGSSGKLGALGERRGGVAGATSATRGTSSAPPFPLPFRPPSSHRKCSPQFPKSELEKTLEVIYFRPLR